MPGQTTTVEGNHDMWSTRIMTLVHLRIPTLILLLRITKSTHVDRMGGVRPPGGLDLMIMMILILPNWE